MDSIWTGLEFFHKGGPVMYVLLLCSIFVLAVGLERWLYFSRMDAGRNFARSFYACMTERHYVEASRLLQGTKGMLPAILQQAAARCRLPEGNVTAFMELQSGIAISRLRRRLYYLHVIVTMAPLLGLLGTISGMISAFSVFNLEAGQSAAITGGVVEALIATAMGLCVAILALLIHAYFSQRIDNIITDMEQSFSLMETAGKKLADLAEKGEAAYAAS